MFLVLNKEILSRLNEKGKLFAFENFDVTPDILTLAKGMGGGMPIGAFISSFEYMNKLKENPKLGHITTFGGHPVIAASALATLKELFKNTSTRSILEKEKLFRKLLVHEQIIEIRGRGLMLAIVLKDKESVNQLILNAINKGLLLFWLLFEPKAIRITPPLNISINEIEEGCKIITNLLDNSSFSNC